MLVLSRKEGESIRIGEDIIVKIISLSNNQVRIGIEAPKKYLIYRNELYERIESENIQASKIDKNLFEQIKGAIQK